MTGLILLTQREFAAPVMRPLQAAGAEVVLATTLAELESALGVGTKDVRVISFGSGVIVPARILKALPGPAYNFHPGPPGYPGIFPSVFALYDSATEFGVTLHEMAERVDSGPIVATEQFAIPPHWARLALDTVTFAALLGLLEKHALALADAATPLPHNGDSWSGVRRSRKDFDAFCRLPVDHTTEEFARRLRAAGEGPDHVLTTTRNGKTVRLSRQDGVDVVRGGQPVKP